MLIPKKKKTKKTKENGKTGKIKEKKKWTDACYPIRVSDV